MEHSVLRPPLDELYRVLFCTLALGSSSPNQVLVTNHSKTMVTPTMNPPSTLSYPAFSSARPQVSSSTYLEPV